MTCTRVMADKFLVAIDGDIYRMTVRGRDKENLNGASCQWDDRSEGTIAVNVKIFNAPKKVIFMKRFVSNSESTVVPCHVPVVSELFRHPFLSQTLNPPSYLSMRF